MPTPDERLKLVLETIHEEESQRIALSIIREHIFFTPSYVLEALGEAVVEDIMHDVLIKLLLPPHRGFIESDAPSAYAQKAFKNTLKSHLKKSRRREEILRDEYKPSTENKIGDKESTQNKIDAALVLTKYKLLWSLRERIAVLLSHAPTLIEQEDWEHIDTDEGIPEDPLDEGKAGAILFPAKADETAHEASRRQKNSFRRLRKRAYDKLSKALHED